jgi:hypothetical protein
MRIVISPDHVLMRYRYEIGGCFNPTAGNNSFVHGKTQLGTVLFNVQLLNN